MPASVPQAVQSCHDLLLWVIPQLDKFPRVRRFTLGERIEGGRVGCRKTLRSSFESLRANGSVIETAGVFRSC
jgi:hypothetical protein